MHQGFWTQLPRPIIGLSPMDGVTDHPSRHIQKRYSNPDVIFTEFTSAEGISRNALTLFKDFMFDETQRPIVAQIFGKEPRAFYVTAVILGYLGFDGIDINMGCPAKNVQQHGAGAALICTPNIAQELVRQTRQGIQDWANGLTLDDLPDLKQKTKHEILRLHEQLPAQYKERRELPVSVKTRIGFDRPMIQEWIPRLLETEPAAITLHGRTLKQLYSGQADWEAIAQAAELTKGTKTLLLGNGDINTVEDFASKIEMSHVDGVLIGRATNGNPWFIGDLKRYRDEYWKKADAQTFKSFVPEFEDMKNVTIQHSRLFEASYPDAGFLPMRKHLGWYLRGFPNASDLRTKIILSNSAQEVQSVLENFEG